MGATSSSGSQILRLRLRMTESVSFGRLGSVGPGSLDDPDVVNVDRAHAAGGGAAGTAHADRHPLDLRRSDLAEAAQRNLPFRRHRQEESSQDLLSGPVSINGGPWNAGLLHRAAGTSVSEPVAGGLASRPLSSTGSQIQVTSFADLQGLHPVPVVLNDGVTVAEIVRWHVRLMYLRGILILIRLRFRVLAPPRGECRRHFLYFVTVLG